MRIEFETSGATPGEMTALMALLALLGGRLPNATVTAAPRGPTPAPVEAVEPIAPSEQLIAEAAARASVPGELDANGVPWDERIHASTKSQTGAGIWTRRRGVDDVTYGRIFAELQEKHAGNHATGTPTNGAESSATDIAAISAAPPPPVADAPAAPPPPPVDAGNVPAPPPPTASAPTAAAPVAAANAPGAGRFAGFPDFVQAVSAIRTPNIPYLELNTYAQSLGVAGGFKDMKDHPELWGDFYSMAGGQ